MIRLGIDGRMGAILLVIAAAQAVVALLFITRVPFAVELWPLPLTGEMTFYFIASFAAAAAASTTWAVLWGEPGSVVGIALDYIVIFVPMSAYLLLLDPAKGGGPTPLVVALLGAVGVGAWLLWWSLRRPLGDPRPTPRLVLAFFAVFVVVLAVVGAGLVVGTPNVVPWSVTSEVSVVSGLMYLGAASYFGYGLLRRRWTNAGGQLAGFLAYDLVLIVPLLMRSQSVYTDWGPSLAGYLVVVVGSGVLAVWYLFVSPETRILGPRQLETETVS